MSKSFSNILQSGGYILPAATLSTLGGVKVDGTTVTINASGVISSAAASTYTLPTASASTLGGIKIGAGLAIDGSGVASVSGLSITAGKTLTASASITLAGTDSSTISVGGNVTFSGGFATTLTVTAATTLTLPTTGTLISTAPGTSGNVLTSNGTSWVSSSGYSLPTAGASTLGGIKIGSGLSVDGSGVASVSGLSITAGKTLTASASITLAGTDSSTISVGGNVTFSGAYTTTLTVGANTTLTLPTTGTLISTAPGTSGNVLTSNGTSWVSSAPTGAAATISISPITTAYTVVAGDLGKVINCTSGTFTVSLSAAATLGTGFTCSIWNTGTNAITIDPNASETIDGLLTFILRMNEGVGIICDGTKWFTSYAKNSNAIASNMSPSSTRPTASGNYSVAIGNSATASGAYSYAFGSNTTVTSSGNSSIAIYGNATSDYSTAIGFNSGATLSQAVTGSGAMALGGSYASGTDSFAAAVANNTSSYGALSICSIAIGYQAKASGNTASSTTSIALGASSVVSAGDSIAIGSVATCSVQGSIAIGAHANSNGAGGSCTSIGYYANANAPGAVAIATSYSFTGATASGQSSIVIGEDISTSARYGIALGASVQSLQYGKFVFGSGKITNRGDAQYGNIVLRTSTTTASATVLTSDGAAASASNQIILPNDSTYAFTILVVARRSDVDGENAGWEFKGVVSRDTNAASTLLRGVSKTTLYKAQAAWDCTVTQDTTNGGIAITVTGEAAKTILWVATAQTSEVTG